MKRASGRLWPFGIRLQLMIWYTVVFAILLFFSDAILYTQLQNSLLANLDTALQVQAEQVASGITNERGNITIQDVTGDLPETNFSAADPSDNRIDVTFGTLIRILDGKGKELRSSPAFHTLIVPEASMSQEVIRGTPWQGETHTHTGQEVRLYSMALIDNGKPYAIIQVGGSLAQLNSSLQSLLIELLLIAPFAILLGAIGSYWLAARAFIPVNNLIDTAHSINAGDLHQRVPVPRARDEIRRLAQTLNEMIERLDQAFSRQRRFVADASHELRTPVTVIRSMTELAAMQPLKAEEYSVLLDTVNSEAERLGQLISDLLILAQSDEKKTKLDWEAFRLDRLIEAVGANAQVLADEQKIELEVQKSEEITILGDEARIIQVVINLLDNAILYTNMGGKVTLKVEKRETEGCIILQDSGIGIAAEHLPHIFERFYRVDPARVRTEGSSSGLGLAIVEWIVQAHGGRITIESQVGQGSTFRVYLPRKREVKEGQARGSTLLSLL